MHYHDLRSIDVIHAELNEYILGNLAWRNKTNQSPMISLLKLSFFSFICCNVINIIYRVLRYANSISVVTVTIRILRVVLDMLH